MGILDWLKRKPKVDDTTTTALTSSPNKRWRYASDGITKIQMDD